MRIIAKTRRMRIHIGIHVHDTHASVSQWALCPRDRPYKYTYIHICIYSFSVGALTK